MKASEFEKHDIKILKDLYKAICKSESIQCLPLIFTTPVGKGGACCEYINGAIKKCISIKMYLPQICCGSAEALLHEVAHQMEIKNANNATHNRSFKKTFETLKGKYLNHSLARQLYW